MSILVRSRPDLWFRGLTLAIETTGYLYAPKTNGRLFACYGGSYVPYVPPKPKTPREIEEEEQEQRRRDIEYLKTRIFDIKSEIKDEGHRHDRKIEELERELKELEEELNKKSSSLTSSVVSVPDGAMEWLLHEVGHWVAASPEERIQVNYGLTPSETGHDGDREWQAWAFEEIVLAPFGPARDFAAPTQRDGAGFSKVGPVPLFAMRHAESRIEELGIELEPWRAVYGDWIAWGKSLGPGRAPWETDQ